MRERLQEWAPYLGALGVALFIVAGVLRLLNQTIDPAILLGLVGVGIVLVALYVINRPSEIRGAVTGRTALYGSNVLLQSVLFVLIVGAVIYLTLNVPQIQRVLHQRWDVTAGKSHTLSGLTINVLTKDVTEPIHIIGFFVNDPNSTSGQLKSDLDQKVKDYQGYTDKISYRVVDPQTEPQLAQQYDIATDGTIVVERGSGPTARNEKIFAADENSLTNAILKVVKTEQKVIYFTTGHGEALLSDTNQTGLSFAAIILDQYNYKAATLNLATSASAPLSGTVPVSGTIGGSLPVDTSAVVIAGPTKPFPPEDAARIKDYLDKGGHLLILLSLGADPGFQDLFTAYGVDAKNDLVLDPGQAYQGNAIAPIVTQFASHAITKDLQQFGLLMPESRSVSAAQTPPAGRTPTELFKTTDKACTKNYDAIKGAQTIPPCDPNNDPKGPFSLGVVVEDSTSKSRLIVIGTNDVATNQFLQLQGNSGGQALWGNLVNWLAGQEDLLAIPANTAQTPTIGVLTGTDQNLILWSNILLLPAAILLIGGIIWWTRR